MENKIKLEVLDRIEKNNKKPITVKQEGFICSKLHIEKLAFDLDYDILKLKDELSEIYFSINVNQIYKIEENKRAIHFYLDNDTQIEIY